MKSKIFYACLFAASVLTSCSDFLEEKPKGVLSGDVYFSAEKINQTQSWTNPMYPQWQGDDMTANPASNKQAVAALDAFGSDGGNKGVTDAWNLHYNMIKAANFIIDGAAKTTLAKETYAEALGNALYWRAYGYFYLVRVFGPVPLILKTASTTEIANELQTMAPSSVDAVYSQIVKDLQEAENLLPTSYSEAPRHHDGIDAWITKQASQATLSAVYMAMAGYPLNKGTEYYKLAADKAKQVIDNNGTYGFYVDPVWSHVYSMGHNYNKETLVGIDNNWNCGSWDHDSELTSCNRFESLGDGGWGDSWGEIAFWKRFPEGPRKDAIYAPKITFQKDATITGMCDWWELNDKGEKKVAEYHPMFSVYTVNCIEGNAWVQLEEPYDYTKPNYMNMTNGRRHRLVRYSEVLLWYAESAARSGAADLTFAKKCLKDVRKRAVTDYMNVTLSNGTKVNIDAMNADQLAEACYIEHGWEVAGQWTQMVTRRADELRMNELKKNFDYRVQNPEIVVHVDANGKEYKAKESVAISNTNWVEGITIYCPYPTDEVEKNPNLKR